MILEAMEPHKTIKLFGWCGVENSFFDLNIDTLIYTWIAMALLIVLGLVGRHYLKKDYHPVGEILKQSIGFFVDLSSESVGYFKYEYFSFIATMFFFTLFCNLACLIPYLKEPTIDPNTAFALGFSSFFFVQYQAVKGLGFFGYCKTFIEPIPLLLPLEIVGKLASILSMSFRLFGNILGGAIVYSLLVSLFEHFKVPFMIFAYVILAVYWLLNKKYDLSKHKIVSYIFSAAFIVIFFLTGAQMFFGIFEGFIQAFVITMLTITYLSVALAHGSDEEHLQVEHSQCVDNKISGEK